MNITLTYAASVNGMITKGDDPDISSWRSPEDWQHFVKLREASEVVIVDRKTYEVVRPKPEPNKLRLVFTSQPSKFQSVPGQLEFVNTTPSELAKRLTKAGYKQVLLAGGAGLSRDFLAAGLVDNMYVTVEPVLFAAGRPMLEEGNFAVSLELQSSRQLNARGTLLLHYKISNHRQTSL